jgi:hypothetical protein
VWCIAGGLWGCGWGWGRLGVCTPVVCSQVCFGGGANLLGGGGRVWSRQQVGETVVDALDVVYVEVVRVDVVHPVCERGGCGGGVWGEGRRERTVVGVEVDGVGGGQKVPP